MSIWPVWISFAICVTVARPDEHCLLRVLTAVDEGRPAENDSQRYEDEAQSLMQAYRIAPPYERQSHLHLVARRFLRRHLRRVPGRLSFARARP